MCNFSNNLNFKNSCVHNSGHEQKIERRNAMQQILKNHTKNYIIEEEEFDEYIDEEIEFDNPQEARRFMDFTGKNQLGSKENVPSYEIIKASKLEEGEEPLSRVIGHENQKKELLSVIDWFKRSKELKARGVSIPRGVIIFGEPGNGKSLMIK